jgi:hypothetical protein
MRYGLICIGAVIGVTLAFTSAHPQAPGAQPSAAQDPPSTQVQTVPAQCPAGVSGPCWKLQYSQGGNQWEVKGQSYIAHSPADTVPATTCKTDSDCPPGPGRCLRNGYCMRVNMGCHSDSDCKDSEFCDTSHAFHMPEDPGTCAPRGGHY